MTNRSVLTGDSRDGRTFTIFSMKQETICGSTRLVVTLNASFAMFVINLLRTQFSLSILCMTGDPALPHSNVNDSYSAGFTTVCGNDSAVNEDTSGSISGADGWSEDITIPNHNLTALNATQLPQGEFVWNKQWRGFVLSAFFWGYVVTQIPGGLLAGRFGPKHVISAGMFVAISAHMLTPIAATLHPYLVFLLRVLVGLGSGVMMPGLHSLFGRWAPPMERSGLMAPTYAGGVISICVALGVTGLLCDVIGWQSIFYIYGIISYLWLLLWCYNVYNSPSRHPRISAREQRYIQTAIGSDVYAKKLATPWGAILRSGPAWAINAAHFCDNWGQYTLLTSTPTYMKEILHFDIQTNGLLVAMPYLVMYLTALTVSQVADWLQRSRILTTTHVRKLYQTIGFVFPAVFLVALGFVQSSQRTLAIGLLTLSVAFQAFSRVGYFINHVDIAPRLSGLLCGISNTIATVPGMVAPYLAAALTPNGTQDEWRIVFFICSALYLFGMVVYLLLGSGEEQAWARAPRDPSSLSVTLRGHRVRGSGEEQV